MCLKVCSNIFPMDSFREINLFSQQTVEHINQDFKLYLSKPNSNKFLENVWSFNITYMCPKVCNTTF